MLESAITNNLGIWLIKKNTHLKKSINQNIFFYDYKKKYVIYAYNCRLNQSGQHNL